MFDIHYAEDIVRGRNNLGNRHIIKDLTEDVVRENIVNMNKMHGKANNYGGLLVWTRGNDTYSFSIYKDGKPFNLTNT